MPSTQGGAALPPGFGPLAPCAHLAPHPYYPYYTPCTMLCTLFLLFATLRMFAKLGTVVFVINILSLALTLVVFPFTALPQLQKKMRLKETHELFTKFFALILGRALCGPNVEQR